MSKPARIDTPTRLVVYIPASVHTRLDLLLWSELEGRVPHGARSAFVEKLVREALERIAAGGRQ